jgi:hypothetical protein
MRITSFYCLLFLALAVQAGDDASGPIQYRVDLSQAFTTYVVTDADKTWALSLASTFKYTKKITYFTQTSLSLDVDGRQLDGAIYRQVDDPTCFYALPSDSMLKLGTQWAASPGVGGFSIHAPRSKRFLVALNSHCVRSVLQTPARIGLSQCLKPLSSTYHSGFSCV